MSSNSDYELSSSSSLNEEEVVENEGIHEQSVQDFVVIHIDNDVSLGYNDPLQDDLDDGPSPLTDGSSDEDSSDDDSSDDGPPPLADGPGLSHHQNNNHGQFTTKEDDREAILRDIANGG